MKMLKSVIPNARIALDTPDGTGMNNVTNSAITRPNSAHIRMYVMKPRWIPILAKPIPSSVIVTKIPSVVTMTALIRDSDTYLEAAMQFRLMKNENTHNMRKRTGVGSDRRVNNRIIPMVTMNHIQKYLWICSVKVGCARRYATTPNVIAN